MSTSRFSFVAAAMAAAGAFALADEAGAQERFVNFAGKEPTTRELIDALRLAPAGARTRTRAINLAPMFAAAETTSAAAPGAKASLDQIHFEFDSSRLTPAAQRILARVGEALASSALAGASFVVEGHTDAQGSDEYNYQLSVRRAESVKQHLVARHRIPAARLKAVGKGETDLLDQADPESAANRRVVFASFAAGSQ